MSNKYWVGGTGTWAAALATQNTSAISAIGSHVLTFTATTNITVGQCVTGTNIPSNCSVASKTATTVTLTGTAFTIAVASGTVVTFSNWATTTGGATNATIPVAADVCIFDINANGTGGGNTAYTVTRTATATITGITMDGNVTFAGSAIVGITGSLSLGTNYPATFSTLPTWTLTGIVTISGTVNTTLNSKLTTFASPINASMSSGITITGTGIVTQSTYTHTTGQNAVTSITCTTFICIGGTLTATTMNCTSYTHTSGSNTATTTNCAGALNHVSGIIDTTLTCSTYTATGTLATNINATKSATVTITGNATTVCNITNNLFASTSISGIIFNYTYAGSVGTRLITTTSTNGPYVYHSIFSGSDIINLTTASILGGLNFTGFTGAFAGTAAFTIDSLYTGAGVGYGDLIQTAGTWTNNGIVTITGSYCQVALSVTIASPIVIIGANVFGTGFNTSSTYTHTSGSNFCANVTCGGAMIHTAGTIETTLTCFRYAAPGTLATTFTDISTYGTGITITGSAVVVCNILNANWIGQRYSDGMGIVFNYTYAGAVGTRTITATVASGNYVYHQARSGTDIISITAGSYLGALDLDIGFGGTVSGGAFYIDGTYTVSEFNPFGIITALPITWSNTALITFIGTGVITLTKVLQTLPNPITIACTTPGGFSSGVSMGYFITTGLLTLTSGELYTDEGPVSVGTFTITSNSLPRYFRSLTNPLVISSAGTPLVIGATTTNLTIEPDSIIQYSNNTITAVTINTSATIPPTPASAFMFNIAPCVSFWGSSTTGASLIVSGPAVTLTTGMVLPFGTITTGGTGTTFAITSGSAFTIQYIIATSVVAPAYSLTLTATHYFNSLAFVGFGGTWVNTAVYLYGSLSLCAGMTTSGTNVLTFVFPATIVANFISSGGAILDCPITFNSSNLGSWFLGSSLTVGSTRTVTMIAGWFSDNNNTFSMGYFACSGAAQMSIYVNANWYVSGTGTCWNYTNTIGSSFVDGNPGISSITLSNNTTTARTFAGGNATTATQCGYPILIIGGNTSISTTTITGSNKYTGISSTKTVAHTIQFHAGSTQTFTGGDTYIEPTVPFSPWQITGSAGNLVTITSDSAASHYLVNKSSKSNTTVTTGVYYPFNIFGDYLTITYSNASTTPQTANWYAGPSTHSTIGTGVTGWLYGYPPGGNFLTAF